MLDGAGQNKVKQRKENSPRDHRLITDGMANNAPTTKQEMISEMKEDRTTISHWPRTTTGLNIRVRGAANAGTAWTILNLFLTFSSVSADVFSDSEGIGSFVVPDDVELAFESSE